MDRGAWQATVHGDAVRHDWATESVHARARSHTHTHTHTVVLNTALVSYVQHSDSVGFFADYTPL